MIFHGRQDVLPANHVACIVHRFLIKSYPDTGITPQKTLIFAKK
jgi:hypothetical protein